MKASLCLEYVGEGFAASERLHSFRTRIASVGLDQGVEIAKMRKPWVARIVGRSEIFGYEREFLRSTTQRQRASGTGNRRVELWFICESGNLYQAQHYVSWRSKDRFFFIVTDEGDIKKVDEAWVRDRLALMCLPPQGNA